MTVYKFLIFLKSHGTHWDEVDLMICQYLSFTLWVTKYLTNSNLTM